MILNTLVLLLLLLPGGIPIYCIGTFTLGFLDAKHPQPEQYSRLQRFSLYRVGILFYNWLTVSTSHTKSILNDHYINYKDILDQEINYQQQDGNFYEVVDNVKDCIKQYKFKLIRNDQIINGRSLKYNGEKLGNKLLSSDQFKLMVEQFKKNSYNISVRILRETSDRNASTRIYIERK